MPLGCSRVRMSNHLKHGPGSPDPQQAIGCQIWALGVAGMVLYRASPHPPRHFVVNVFLVLLVFLSVGLLYLPWEMFSKSMFLDASQVVLSLSVLCQ